MLHKENISKVAIFPIEGHNNGNNSIGVTTRFDSALLSPLVHGQLDVVLHAHVDHVSGCPHESAHGARHARHGHTLRERDGLAARGNLLLRDLVDGEAGRRVGELADERSGEAVVHGQDALVAHDAHRLAHDADLLGGAGRLQVHLRSTQGTRKKGRQ